MVARRWRSCPSLGGALAAGATAAAVLLPMLWPALIALGASVSASPLPWLAVAAAGLLATVPQLRELFDRVAAA